MFPKMLPTRCFGLRVEKAMTLPWNRSCRIRLIPHHRHGIGVETKLIAIPKYGDCLRRRECENVHGVGLDRLRKQPRSQGLRGKHRPWHMQFVRRSFARWLSERFERIENALNDRLVLDRRRYWTFVSTNGCRAADQGFVHEKRWTTMATTGFDGLHSVDFAVF